MTENAPEPTRQPTPEALPQVGADLEFAQFPDEPLVAMAQSGHFPPAMNAVIQRHRQAVNRLLAQWARLKYFPAAELPDAQQEAVFWIMEAVARYDEKWNGKVLACRFRSFLGRVVWARFTNYVRKWDRFEDRHDRSVPVSDAPEEGMSKDPNRGRRGGTPAEKYSPFQAFEHQDWMDHFRATLDPADVLALGVWDRLAAGKERKDIARELGLSDDEARGKLRQVAHRLRAFRQETGE